ncbi:DNA-packaging protein [Escherichia coli]|nr:DNA-packaging protein [Escherichia coli]EGE3525377.1 DNA-packaging protein [Escherichia coli]
MILNISVINVFDNHYHFWWVLSGDPTGYGAATSRIFTIYENFPGSMSGFSAS